MPTKSAYITFENNICYISGQLDFSNVRMIYEKSLPWLERCPAMQFDFSQLSSTNSAGLALLIEWIKLAQKKQKALHFIQLSASLISIAKAAGLEFIFQSPAVPEECENVVCSPI